MNKNNDNKACVCEIMLIKSYLNPFEERKKENFYRKSK